MVLLPCSRCCQPAGECVCSCTCCECADGTRQAAAYETFLTTSLDNVSQDFGSPGGGSPGRAFVADEFSAVQEYLSDCGITRRWSSRAACVTALIAAERAAILGAGGPPYMYDLFDAANGYPTVATDTSSLTLTERQRLWEFAFTFAASGPAYDLLYAAATLADEAEVDAYLADLFDDGSYINLDPIVSLWGYCSNSAEVTPDGDYWLGWSIPYRNGVPFTIAELEALCPSGVPFHGGSPPLAWFWPVFESDSQPIIRSVVLASSTGDAIADRLIETGTQGKTVVEDELGYALPDWTKVVTTTADSCDVNGNASGTGEKVCTIQVDYQTTGVHERWTLFITLSTCVNREDDTPDYGGVSLPHVVDYVFTYDDDPPNNPVSYQSKIASTASIRPYLDETDCEGIRTETPCTGGLWQVFTEVEAGNTVCCGRRAAE